MIYDITTIIWKEAKELFLQSPKFRGGWMGMLVFFAVFGILIPLQSGPEFVEQPASLLVWIWLPFFLTNSIVADSFAGERERHTLETLLASRLSDTSILLGKITAAIIYGFGLTFLNILIALVTVNVVHGGGRLLLFPLPTLLGGLLLCFLVATLASGLGVLVSLRASTVRQAQQTLSFAFFILFVPIILLPLLPASVQVSVAQFIQGLDLTSAAMAAGVVLLILDITLIAAGLVRFRRSRLILD
jgi:ABC-2 type transport system permease protein